MAREIVMLKNITKSFSLREQENVLKSFTNNFFPNERKKLVALDDVSFNVLEGEVLGIIGLNGSGKTTLLRTIAGIYTPDAGRIEVRGTLAPLLQIGVGFQNELDAEENIMISGMLMGMSKSEIMKKKDSIIQFAELTEFSKMRLKHYSSGMRVRLAFSTALQMNPDVLLVDEILSVGDLPFRKKSFDSILSFKEKGKTIIYTSHNLDMLSKLCNRVLFLHNGKVKMDGDPEVVIKKFKEFVNLSKNKK